MIHQTSTPARTAMIAATMASASQCALRKFPVAVNIAAKSISTRTPRCRLAWLQVPKPGAPRKDTYVHASGSTVWIGLHIRAGQPAPTPGAPGEAGPLYRNEAVG